ncbi:MAG: trypsin-like peptidase domain-containing protein [Clostridia bacterium]|nr:trypsin-like peptidase domain-containing protein [Clostridia bacterium]MBR6512628.1 trypsin-like peptidase domain-containing protein [Clostridia bacterium]
MEENNTTPKKTGKSGRVFFIIMLVAILLIAGIASITIILQGKSADKERKRSSDADMSASIEIEEAKEYDAKSTDGTLTSVEIAEKVKPSVMAVITYKGNTITGEGSGIFMSEDITGTYTYVLTCAHIVKDAGITTKIELEDGTQYDADVVGYDTRTDVAVLRVKATGFTIAEFGDSTVLKVGEPVYAIGNPGGTAYYGSFTGGYVSAISRPTISSASAYTQECIQHDAAINPGNSGGALVNSYGQVIGMNSSKIAAEEYEGMGFAIPSSVFKSVADDILSTGYVKDRAKLGISYMPTSDNLAYSRIVSENKLPAGTIIIASIDPSSSLYDTDVQAGDMIIAANGKDLDKVDVLLSIIEKAKPGDKLELRIVHVNRDYSIDTFDIVCELVEDTGTAVTEDKDSADGDFDNPFGN